MMGENAVDTCSTAPGFSSPGESQGNRPSRARLSWLTRPFHSPFNVAPSLMTVNLPACILVLLWFALFPIKAG